MKLLLTSSGITNDSIANALFELVGKKPEQTKVVFIPTASNVEVGDKGWLINDLVNLQKRGFAEIDIVDVSAVEEKVVPVEEAPKKRVGRRPAKPAGRQTSQRGRAPRTTKPEPPKTED